MHQVPAGIKARREKKPRRLELMNEAEGHEIKLRWSKTLFPLGVLEFFINLGIE